MKILLNWEQFNESRKFVFLTNRTDESHYTGPRGSNIQSNPYYERAVDRTTRAINGFHGYNQFFKDLAYKLDIVYVDDASVPRAATDGSRIFINPKFWAGLSVKQAQFVIAHEILHCSLLHFDRLYGRDHNQWNIATDYEINLLLVNNQLISMNETQQIGALISHKYEGMGAEEIYELPEIAADAASRKNKPEKPKDDNGDDQGDDQGNDQLKVGDIIQNDATGEYGRVTSINEDSVEYTPITEAEARNLVK
jgi:hypothetical protein